MRLSSTAPTEGPRHWSRTLAAAAFWLLLWQLASLAVAQPLLLPSPLSVAQTLSGLVVTSEFWSITAQSLMRIGVGFIAGVVVGTAAAFATTRWSTVDVLISGPLRIIRATPVASFAILALVWIPSGGVPAAIVFVMVTPLVWDTIAAGLRQRDRELLEMAEVFAFSRWDRLRRVELPGLRPYFVTASTNAMGLAWKAGIAAEVISHPDWAIGSSLAEAKVYLETPTVFAWTIVAVTLSLMLERALRAITARWAQPIATAARSGASPEPREPADAQL